LTVIDYLRILLNARLATMDERGASAVEYALMAAAIAVAIVGVTGAFVITLHAVFRGACGKSADTGTC
jgi:pilus assembly protein Flp/PilA